MMMMMMMMTTSLADLILLRLLAPEKPGRAGVSRSRLTFDLCPLWPEGGGAAPWAEAFAGAWRGLREAGHVTAGGRGGGRLGLTAAGETRARAAFGLPPGEGLPAGGWAALREGYALPRALGMKGASDAAGATRTADGLRAALLRRFLLGGARGADTLRGAVDLLLARTLVVPRPTVAEFRRAALRRGMWTERAPGEGAARLLEDLPAFAALVRETARGVRTGRFGEHKIFIVHVWRALLGAGRAVEAEEAAFKERLVRAHAAGLLGLARADLTGAFDPADVSGSEVHYHQAAFHFLRLD